MQEDALDSAPSGLTNKERHRAAFICAGHQSPGEGGERLTAGSDEDDTHRPAI